MNSEITLDPTKEICNNCFKEEKIASEKNRDIAGEKACADSFEETDTEFPYVGSTIQEIITSHPIHSNYSSCKAFVDGKEIDINSLSIVVNHNIDDKALKSEKIYKIHFVGLDEDSAEFADKNRVIEYANHRLEANPEDREEFNFDTFNLTLEQAIDVIKSYDENVEILTHK